MRVLWWGEGYGRRSVISETEMTADAESHSGKESVGFTNSMWLGVFYSDVHL